MFYVRASEPATADKSVLRRSRPSCFNGQFAHAAKQRNASAYHRRIAAPKLMFVVLFDLNSGALAVRCAGQRHKDIYEPFGRRAPQQIVTTTKIEIVSNVAPAAGASAFLRLRQGQLPLFFELTHAKKVKSKKVKGKSR